MIVVIGYDGCEMPQHIKNQPSHRWTHAAVALGLAVVTFMGACSSPEPSFEAAATDSAAPPAVVGRSTCPGSVPEVKRAVEGAAAASLEELQGTLQEEPGFLAVVYDGQRPIVIVEPQRLLEWQARMAPRGVGVARSCIDPALLEVTREAVSKVEIPEGAAVSIGYDALDDAITISGVSADDVIRAVEELAPGAGGAARAAIADGTLRIHQERLWITR